MVTLQGVDTEGKSGVVFEVGHKDYGKSIIVGNKISLVRKVNEN